MVYYSPQARHHVMGRRGACLLAGCRRHLRSCLSCLPFSAAPAPAVRVKRNPLHLPQWGCGQPAAAAAAPAAEGAGGGGAAGQQQQEQQGQQEEQQQQHLPQSHVEQGEQQQEGEAQQQQQQPGGELPDLELMERVSAYPASKSWGRADTAPKASAQCASPAVPPRCAE